MNTNDAVHANNLMDCGMGVEECLCPNLYLFRSMDSQARYSANSLHPFYHTFSTRRSIERLVSAELSLDCGEMMKPVAIWKQLTPLSVDVLLFHHG